MAKKRKSNKTLLRINKTMAGLGSRPILLFYVVAFVIFGLAAVFVSRAAGVTAGTTGLLASGLKNSAGTVMCLDDYKQGTSNGNPINIFPCNKADAGQQFTPYSDGTIRIKSKCASVENSSNANGAKIILTTCGTSNYMKWRRHTDPRNGLNNLVSTANDKCLDVLGAKTANNSGVNLWDCNNTDGQVWGWVTGTSAVVQGGATWNANCNVIGGEEGGDGCHVHIGATQDQNDHFSAQGVQADFLQGKPVCTTGCGFSLTEFFAAGAGAKNAVEFGWGVHGGDPTPRLGIGLYANGKGIDADANFVSQNSTLKPGSAVTPGAKGTFKIWYNPATGRWNLYYNGTWLGFFPQSVWTSRGTSFTSLGFLETFGEVVQPRLTVAHMQMGNGLLGTQSGSASVSNYQLISSNVPGNYTGAFGTNTSQYYNYGNFSSTGFNFGGPGIF